MKKHVGYFMLKSPAVDPCPGDDITYSTTSDLVSALVYSGAERSLTVTFTASDPACYDNFSIEMDTLDSPFHTIITQFTTTDAS